MIINISNFKKDSYLFALNYLQKHKPRWDNEHVLFFSDLLKGLHDNEDFDIDPDASNWEHLMIAERYVEKNKKKYQNAFERDSIMEVFNSEMGMSSNSNPFKRRKRGGGKTKRRIRRRARRTHRHRA